MEWTREKTLALINEYRKRRGLWDMTHDDYRKKDIKQKLLMEVSASLGGGIPIVEIEKKFHTLRTQYHREINRMKRKEPYNSKWFGFKNLQFLSSPKACRSVKGRIKSEITEDGTVTSKYIVRETVMPQHDTSAGSANSSNNMSDEFITLHRKPNNITYEAVNSSAGNAGTSTSRSHELEKLIEETTKDVEEIEDAKPKMTVALEHHTYNAQIHAAGGDELHNTDQDPLHNTAEGHHQHHHAPGQQMDEDEEPIESIDIQPAEEEIAYQSSTSTGGGAGGPHQGASLSHHGAVPTRIIKIQRRDTCQDEYYDEEQQQQHDQQTSTPHHMHTLSASGGKRIYYEPNGQQHTAILNTSSTGGNAVKRHSQPQAAHLNSRDEYVTYGEYVANEMRGISNREVLVALKHKINTALFEAHMAELQK